MGSNTLSFERDITVNSVKVGRGNSNVSGNVVVGELSGTSFTTGNNSVAIGYRALTSVTTQSENIGIGFDALRFATGSRNIGIGAYRAGYYMSGTNNVSIGHDNLSSVTNSGSYNIAIGTATLRALTTGGNNIGIGLETGLSITTGNNNTNIGYQSNTGTTTTSNVTSLGFQSLYFNSANNNTAVGYQAGIYTTTGSNNIYFGYLAGAKFGAGGSNLNQTSSNSIYIGYQTTASANGNTNEIVIGYNETGLGSNTTIIGNSSTVTTAIRGRLLLGTTTDSGSYQLDVNGTGRFTNKLTVDVSAVNDVALFRGTEPYITIEAFGASNPASIFLKPSTSAQNGTIQNRTGGGLEFYVNADYTNAKMTIKGTTVNIRSLPTSTTGLSSGDLWNDAGTVKVV
jgi:hypothetical protein